MIAKFEEDPPLTTKPTGEAEDPNDLLAYVSKIKMHEGQCWETDALNLLSVSTNAMYCVCNVQSR